MTKEIWNEEGTQFIRSEEAIPICGVDFCDTCGDCLACFADSMCFEGGSHRWVQYGENEEE